MKPKGFQVGDIVRVHGGFSRAKWPGIIIDPPPGVEPKANKHYIYFFGTRAYYWLPDRNIEYHKADEVQKRPKKTVKTRRSTLGKIDLLERLVNLLEPELKVNKITKNLISRLREKWRPGRNLPQKYDGLIKRCKEILKSKKNRNIFDENVKKYLNKKNLIIRVLKIKKLKSRSELLLNRSVKPGVLSKDIKPKSGNSSKQNAKCKIVRKSHLRKIEKVDKKLVPWESDTNSDKGNPSEEIKSSQSNVATDKKIKSVNKKIKKGMNTNIFQKVNKSSEIQKLNASDENKGNVVVSPNIQEPSPSFKVKIEFSDDFPQNSVGAPCLKKKKLSMAEFSSPELENSSKNMKPNGKKMEENISGKIENLMPKNGNLLAKKNLPLSVTKKNTEKEIKKEIVESPEFDSSREHTQKILFELESINEPVKIKTENYENSVLDSMQYSGRVLRTRKPKNLPTNNEVKPGSSSNNKNQMKTDRHNAITNSKLKGNNLQKAKKLAKKEVDTDVKDTKREIKKEKIEKFPVTENVSMNHESSSENVKLMLGKFKDSTENVKMAEKQVLAECNENGNVLMDAFSYFSEKAIENEQIKKSKKGVSSKSNTSKTLKYDEDINILSHYLSHFSEKTTEQGLIIDIEQVSSKSGSSKKTSEPDDSLSEKVIKHEIDLEEIHEVQQSPKARRGKRNQKISPKKELSHVEIKNEVIENPAEIPQSCKTYQTCFRKEQTSLLSRQPCKRNLADKDMRSLPDPALPMKTDILPIQAATPPINMKNMCENLQAKINDIKATRLKIGFLGLGNIGRGMVKNLIHSGHQVILWNRTSDTCEEFIASGAIKCMTPSDVASASDIIFSCMSDSEAVYSTVFLNNGVLSGLKECSLSKKAYVELSSIDASMCQRVSDAITSLGGRYLAAPMCGSRKLADEGSMLFFAGGNLSLYDDCSSCFQATGKKSFYYGEEIEYSIKMCGAVNTFLGSANACLGEAMALVDRCNLPKAGFLGLIRDTQLNCPFFVEKSNAMRRMSFITNTSLKHQQKDMGMHLEMARKCEQPLVLTTAANELYKHAKLLGYANHDIASVLMATE